MFLLFKRTKYVSLYIFFVFKFTAMKHMFVTEKIFKYLYMNVVVLTLSTGMIGSCHLYEFYFCTLVLMFKNVLLILFFFSCDYAKEMDYV